jgi:hypothetical protein
MNINEVVENYMDEYFPEVDGIDRDNIEKDTEGYCQGHGPVVFVKWVDDDDDGDNNDENYR